MERLHPIRKRSDLEPVRRVAEGLIGEECWRASAPLETLYLYLGKKRYVHRGLLGAWQVHALSCPWDLLYRQTALASAEQLETREAMEEALEPLVGKTVRAVEIDFPALSLELEFEAGYGLVLDPTRIQKEELEDEGEEEEPFWQVLYPEHMLIAVGPGPVWRKGRSDI